jgi:hypothetical protein
MRFRYKTQSAQALTREKTRPPTPRRNGDRAIGSRIDKNLDSVPLSITRLETVETRELKRVEAFHDK